MSNRNWIYRKRLKKLQTILKKFSGVAIISGNPKLKKSEDLKIWFRNSDLLYFAGTTNQNLSLIVTPEELFITQHEEVNEVWETKPKDIKEVSSSIGAIVLDLAKVEEKVGGFENLFFQNIEGCFSKQIAKKILASSEDPLKKKPRSVSFLSQITAELREVKDQTELDAIDEACKITLKIFTDFKRQIAPGFSEIEMKNFLLSLIYKHQVEPSFEPIVAVQENSTILHHSPTHRVLRKSEMLLVDFGVYFNGYSSDFTRVLFTQHLGVYEKVFTAVKRANFFLRNILKPGMTNKEIQNKVEDKLKLALKKNGLKYDLRELFPHSWGHSLGLDVHDPSIFKSYGSKIKANSVVTIEPGLYFRKGLNGVKFGVRFEDVLRVSSTKNEIFTAGFENFEDLFI